MSHWSQVDWQQPVNLDCPLNRGLVSWWLAGENPFWGGGRFWDIYGRNHGTLTNGPTWGGALGRPGGWGRLTTDGVDDYVATGYSMTEQAFSLFLWAEVLGGDNYSPLAATGWGSQGLGINRTTDAPASVYCEVRGASALSQVGYTGRNGQGIGGWHHIGLTYASDLLAIYIDGQQWGTSSTAPGTITHSFALRFGDNTATEQCAMNFDDARLYNRALSAGEAWNLYSDSRQGYPLTLNRLRRATVFDTAGGAATTTRGMPFGHRSTAFNGGRTLVGVCR